MSLLGQTEIRIVLAENEPVFAAAGHHPVRLIGALRHQIIDQRSDIGLVAAQDERLLTPDFQRRIDTRHEPLRRSLLIAARSVRLTCRIQPGQLLDLQRGIQLERVQQIVLNRIGRTHDLHILQAGNGPQESILHIHRHGRGHSLDIHFIRIQPLRLDEQLMPVLVGEAHNLILDGRAVARPLAVNLSGILRRLHDIVPENLMGRLIRIGQPAEPLIPVHPVIHKGKCVVFRIALLQRHFLEMERTHIHAARRPGLEPERFQAVLPEIVCQSHRGTHPVRAAGVHRIPDDNFTVQVRPRTENDRLGPVFLSQLRHHARAASVLQENIHDLRLLQVQIFRILNDLLHEAVISLLIRLGPQRIHRRPLSAVQHAHLHRRPVRSDSHFSAQSIDFLHQMALSRSSDGRIAGHHGYIVQRNRKKTGLFPQPGGSQSRFASRMARSHYNHIICICKKHSSFLFHPIPFNTATAENP